MECTYRVLASITNSHASGDKGDPRADTGVPAISLTLGLPRRKLMAT